MGRIKPKYLEIMFLAVRTIAAEKRISQILRLDDVVPGAGSIKFAGNGM